MNMDVTLEFPKRGILTLVSGWRGAVIMTAATAVLAQVSFPIPFSPVPFSLQPFAIMLTGILLGKRWGLVSVLQYLMLGAMGAPVFALWRAGLPVLFGHTGGYLMAYPFAVMLIGLLMEQLPLSDMKRAYVACLAGLSVIYTFGCVWLAMTTGGTMSALQVAIAGAGWFLIWDLVKACVVAQTYALVNRH